MFFIFLATETSKVDSDSSNLKARIDEIIAAATVSSQLFWNLLVCFDRLFILNHLHSDG